MAVFPYAFLPVLNTIDVILELRRCTPRRHYSDIGALDRPFFGLIQLLAANS